MAEKYYIFGEDGYIDGCGTGILGKEIIESEYNRIFDIIKNIPQAPQGYQYRLRESNLEWELIELPEEE